MNFDKVKWRERLSKWDVKTDPILGRVIKSKYSILYVAAYSFVWYLLGYYVGDIVHWMGQLM